MKARFNWGTGIAIFIGIFLITMAFLVYKTTQQRVDMVGEDYYPKELLHESHLDKERTYNLLAEKVKISREENRLLFRFPASLANNHVEGSITFYRPSDNSLDVSYSIALNESGSQEIETSELITGKYIIKLDFKVESKSYYYEQIFIR